MDVKYIPSDWEKMKDGIGDLIGLGRWGKGMIDTLKDLSDNLEDAESDIANYDSDRVITFHHTSQKGKYQGLFEDFEILHSFTGKVGDIVDRTIDQPFYEDMDAFVEAMRVLTISNYTTTNRVGVTETQYVYAGYGPAQSFEVPKTEVSLDDLFSGDNYYSSQMKLEYDTWKELNPDQEFSQEEYQQAVLNTRAFEYESIRNQQEDKEFWVQIGALVVIVGATLICPPAGLALGAAYGAMELSSAVSGKDWVSGRELGTGERWFRGLLAPLDIVPGVSGLTKFSSTVRLAHLGENIGAIGLRSGVKGSIHQGVAHIDHMVKTAGQQSVTRLKSASAAIIDTTNVMKNKLVKDTVEAGRLVDSAITQVKNITPPRRMGLAMEGAGDVGKVQIHAENTHAVENRLRDLLSMIEGVNVDTTKAFKEEARMLLQNNIDLKTSESLQKLLTENGYSRDEFIRLLDPDRALTTTEKDAVKSIRSQIGIPPKGTMMAKVIPQSDIYKYLYNDEYKGVRGFTAVKEHSANLKTLYDNYEGARLDYNNTAYKLTNGVDGISQSVGAPDKFYGVIEYKIEDTGKLSIPDWDPSPDSYPYTGRGFTGSRKVVLPEYYQQSRDFIKGDILKIVDSKTGESVAKFAYNEKVKWRIIE